MSWGDRGLFAAGVLAVIGLVFWLVWLQREVWPYVLKSRIDNLELRVTDLELR